MRIGAIAALAAGASLAAGAHAQAITAGGTIEGRLGYSNNPYLNVDSPGNTGVVGGSLTAWVQHATSTSATRLTGYAGVDQNFKYYGRAENYLGTLSHQQTFSSRLNMQANVSYQDSITPSFGNASAVLDSNPIVTAPTVDLLSIGQRSRTISGDGVLNWTPTSRDTFYAGPTISHSSYPGRALSTYDQYGGRVGYLRTITARLKLGVDGSVQQINSKGYSNGTSYQGGARLVYDFNEIWQFNGSLSYIQQRTTKPFRGTSSTIGYTANLCGKYPRYRVCIEAGRQSAPSGLGGLRTDNRVSLYGDYQLTSRSSINVSGTYDRSVSVGQTAVPTQIFWQLTGGYNRTLTERLAAGFSGHYQHRDFGDLVTNGRSNVSGWAGTLDVTYRFGRLE